MITEETTLTLHQQQMKERWVEEYGYMNYTVLPNGRDACINKLMHTYAILADLSYWGYGDRWCFSNYPKAKAALEEWKARDGEGEPTGWHRHPDSGRRREDGDPNKETIDF